MRYVLVGLLACACRPVVAWMYGCPAEEDRFDFGLSPDQNMDGYDDLWEETADDRTDCPGGLTVQQWYTLDEILDDGVYRTHCDGTWCKEEYAGHDWCLPWKLYEDWREESRPPDMP